MFLTSAQKPPSTEQVTYRSQKSSGAAFFPTTDYLIPKLALLDEMVAILKRNNGIPDLSKTVIIGVQHLLETTVTLFDAIIALGVRPENMFFSGKCYSTAPEIEAQVKKRGIYIATSNKPQKPGDYQETCKDGLTAMWRVCLDTIKTRDIERIIILDDGFRCIETMPEIVPLNYKMAAIEQTRAGLYSPDADLLSFPLIEVASSAAKKILEPPLIAAAIISKTKKLLRDLNPDKETTVFGVIGNGSIGYAICRFLLSEGYAVIVYDENENAFSNIDDKRFYRTAKSIDVIKRSNIIFSCTGKDITNNIDVINTATSNKVFISCSSENREFQTLLTTISRNNSLVVDTMSDLTCVTPHGTKITIIRGGFPINFDGSPTSVPKHDIQLTRALLLGGFIQAIFCATKPIKDGITINYAGARLSLNPFVQRFVALWWLQHEGRDRFSSKTHSFFKDVKWIQQNSGGKYSKNDCLFLSFKQEQEKIDDPNPIIRAKL